MYQTELAWNGGPVTNRTDLAEDAMPREAWSATKCCGGKRNGSNSAAL